MLLKFIQVVLAVSSVVTSMAVWAADDAHKVKISGDISLVSAYVSRGATNGPENNDAAIQPYIRADYQHFYAAYWMSKLGYSFKELQDADNAVTAYITKQYTPAQQAAWSEDERIAAFDAAKAATADELQPARAPQGYEHDLFIGYTNDYHNWTYDLQLASYIYPGSKDTTGYEAGIFLSHPIDKARDSAVSIGLQTYLADTYYMNQGDTYLELGYSQALPQDFALNLSTGFSWYQDSGKYEGQGAIGTTTEDFVFRHATVQVSHALFNNEQANGWLKFIVGGDSRNGEHQKNMVVAGMNYSF